MKCHEHQKTLQRSPYYRLTRPLPCYSRRWKNVILIDLYWKGGGILKANYVSCFINLVSCIVDTWWCWWSPLYGSHENTNGEVKLKFEARSSWALKTSSILDIWIWLLMMLAASGHYVDVLPQCTVTQWMFIHNQEMIIGYASLRLFAATAEKTYYINLVGE